MKKRLLLGNYTTKRRFLLTFPGMSVSEDCFFKLNYYCLDSNRLNETKKFSFYEEEIIF